MTSRADGPTYLGVGLYSIPEASRIVGIPAHRVRRWIRTYTYTVKGTRYVHTPVITRYLGEEEPITFLELIELLFVRLFRNQDLSMQYIRSAARIAADLFNTRYPFAVKKFDTDGRRIFATLEERLPGLAQERRVIEELGRGQTVFETVVRPFFRKLEYAGYAEALRYWPLERGGRVVLDPERNFGKPIDAETGVPTRALFDAVATAGEHPLTVAKWFGVPLAAVKAARKYEHLLLRAA